MNAQQMSTEELLARATARPITISRCTCGDPVCNQWFISWTRSDGRLSAEDAELIRRAVGSFEAMREALEIALHMENDRRAGVELSDDDYSVLNDALTKALALANAK